MLSLKPRLLSLVRSKTSGTKTSSNKIIDAGNSGTFGVGVGDADGLFVGCDVVAVEVGDADAVGEVEVEDVVTAPFVTVTGMSSEVPDPGAT
jgi:hypothetical protein